MLGSLFESKDQKRADDSELQRLQRKYGDQLVITLRERVQRPGLSPRDRAHWRRILRKAQSRSFG